MCVHIRVWIGLICWVTAISVSAQVPVPNRDNWGNPFTGNPNQIADQSDNEDEVRGAFVDNRVFGDLFETGLPSFFREGNYRLRLNPKLGDFFDD